ncbi:hypothetical protein [Nocardia camponoti]|uniref:Mce-associated membrane protein n=1 Tax=Nocardia camponoti TaxID=1616106 RepID=A0A917QMH4_9NOCA|nr:hypothetical protein [Nocardia camponoti]GGK58854.1 hypothetical protein GCM10011591_33850 [Nocardia camponoti]
MAENSEGAQVPAESNKGTVALKVSSLLGGAVIAILAVIAIVLAALLLSSHNKLADRDAKAADNAKAEQIALDYATATGNVNYNDFNAWLTALKAGTAKPVADKFDAAAPRLQQIVTILKWTSTATPITAKVMSQDGDVFHVDAFIDTTTTNAQRPDPIRNTVLFTITVDKGQNWQITDVGGTDALLGK